MQCNGCGGEFTALGGVLAYGSAAYEKGRPYSGRTTVWGDYAKTLCPRCQHVLKDILLSSDLSEHWDEYDWSLMGGPYTE